MCSWLIVGLGNPGDEYESTRHNAGFRVVDALAQECGANYWKAEGGALTAKAQLAGCDVVLAKPQSFMNASGGPVKKLLALYDIDPDHLVVIHDELDIAPASVRVKYGGGHAGHNGLRSICEKLGTHDWYRVRCGIGKPPGRMQGSDYVLATPKGTARDDFEQSLHLAAQASVSLLEKGLEKTQQTFHSDAEANTV